MTKEEYRFTETALSNDRVRLQWSKGRRPADPLDFWIVPVSEVDGAKDRVRAGEFEDD